MSHPDTKILILLCFVGLTSFLVTSIGLASDSWLIYQLGKNDTPGDGNATTARVERVGVWRVCYRPGTLVQEDGKGCLNIDYLTKVDSATNPLFHYLFPSLQNDLLLVFLILVMAGVFIIFIAEAMAMICLKKKVKRLYLATAIMFILAGAVLTAGLIVFTVRSDQLLSEWTVDELGLSPYDLLYFGWSFAITWAGAALAVVNGCGYIWLVRLQHDTMM
ncbi:uncharacterized protein LOC117292997 [Asterias rubens]|uniref:uncharacterized protein LOC117292997 n=1 Tax=Asterias rubens TaxID=7604 RepID=UPI00145565EA|nr:uncharacterized protein LOC117292997 [Asterias rubens]